VKTTTKPESSFHFTATDCCSSYINIHMEDCLGNYNGKEIIQQSCLLSYKNAEVPVWTEVITALYNWVGVWYLNK
jgi:hypothetical protein